VSETAGSFRLAEVVDGGAPSRRSVVPVREFVTARNPEIDSTLPYLVRLPLQEGAVVLKVRDVWPRTAKVYCHRALGWPEEPDIIERVPVRSCQRRAAVDLVLHRGRENRSQFVFTRARRRDVIFWQSARTARQARPNVALPTARAAGRTLEIVVDSHERHPWTFNHQQATTQRRALTAGDYAVERTPAGRAFHKLRVRIGRRLVEEDDGDAMASSTRTSTAR
jgi:hypothetical protein